MKDLWLTLQQLRQYSDKIKAKKYQLLRREKRYLE